MIGFEPTASCFQSRRSSQTELHPEKTQKQPLTGAFLFMFGYELIVLGLFLPHLSGDVTATHFFWMLSLFPAGLIVLGSLRNLDKYIEYSRSIQARLKPNKGMMTPMLLYCNLSVGLGLFVIWTVFSIGTLIAAFVPAFDSVGCYGK